MLYNIWYTKRGNTAFDANVDLNGLESTHVRVSEGHRAESLDEAYADHQADMWPTVRYERWGDLVCNRLGASHATMSVGDVIEEVESGAFYAVAHIGFKKLS